MGKSNFRMWGPAACLSYSECSFEPLKLCQISQAKPPWILYTIIYIYYITQTLILTTASGAVRKMPPSDPLRKCYDSLQHHFYFNETKILPFVYIVACSHIWIEHDKPAGVLAVARKLFYRVDFPLWSSRGAPLLQRKWACWWRFHHFKWGHKLLHLNYPQSQLIISVPLTSLLAWRKSFTPQVRAGFSPSTQ